MRRIDATLAASGLALLAATVLSVERTMRWRARRHPMPRNECREPAPGYNAGHDGGRVDAHRTTNMRARPADLLPLIFAAAVGGYVLGAKGAVFDPGAPLAWGLFAACWVLLVAVPLMAGDRLRGRGGDALLAAFALLLLLTPSVRQVLDPVVVVVMGLIAALVYGVGRGREHFHPATFLYRLSPVLLAAFAYVNLKRLAPIDPSRALDALLARIDLALFGQHLSAWTEQFASPRLSDWLALNYGLYFAYPVVTALVLYLARRDREYEDYALCFSLGMFASYLLYLAFPARGPADGLAAFYLQEALPGGAYTRGQLAMVEAYRYPFDAFPSMHTANSLVALWALRRARSKLFWVFAFGEVNLLASTVYLRMHYTVDLVAGVGVAALLVWSAPRLNAAWERRRTAVPDPPRDMALP